MQLSKKIRQILFGVVLLWSLVVFKTGVTEDRLGLPRQDVELILVMEKELLSRIDSYIELLPFPKPKQDLQNLIIGLLRTVGSHANTLASLQHIQLVALREQGAQRAMIAALIASNDTGMAHFSRDAVSRPLKQVEMLTNFSLIASAVKPLLLTRVKPGKYWLAPNNSPLTAEDFDQFYSTALNKKLQGFSGTTVDSRQRSLLYFSSNLLPGSRSKRSVSLAKQFRSLLVSHRSRASAAILDFTVDLAQVSGLQRNLVLPLPLSGQVNSEVRPAVMVSMKISPNMMKIMQEGSKRSKLATFFTLDFSRDVMPWIGDEVILGVFENKNVTSKYPAFVLGINTKSSTTATQTLKNLEARLSTWNMHFSTTSYKQRTVRHSELSLLPECFPAWSVVGDFVVLGYNPYSVKKMIDYLVAMESAYKGRSDKIKQSSAHVAFTMDAEVVEAINGKLAPVALKKAYHKKERIKKIVSSGRFADQFFHGDLVIEYGNIL